MKVIHVALFGALASCGSHHDPQHGQNDAATSDGSSDGQDGSVVVDAPGVTDPFDPASCTGAPMTQPQALAYFAPAATEAALAPYHVKIRSRSCNQLTGCAGWEPATWILSYWAGPIGEQPVDAMLYLNLVSGTVDLSPRADFCNPNESIS